MRARAGCGGAAELLWLGGQSSGRHSRSSLPPALGLALGPGPALAHVIPW